MIVDDEAGARESLRVILEPDYETLTAEDTGSALSCLEKNSCDLMLLDICLPGKSGLDLLKNLKKKNNRLPVVMVSAVKTLKTAVEAMKHGANDYITKPFDVEEIREVVRENLMDRKQAKTAATAVYRRESIIGHATTLKPVFRLVSRLARTDSTVLILGESGTGKELIARALHFESERAGGQFVPVHLSAISENLIESELFGHLKGAFTGADKDREGAFELGNGGTIFLDEIGEISESVQIKLLRVIQEKEFKPVGGSRFKSTDARIITATNKDLYKLVEEGKFRADLYYRLNVVPIQLPSLQERMRDIPELVGFLVEKISGRIRIPAPAVEDSVIEAFMTHSWPGNVRELENTLENMILLCDRDRLTSGDLPDFLKSRNGESETPVLRGTGKENVLASLERETIQMALMRNNGVLTSTAKYLGTTRRILKYKMDKLGIDKTDLFRN